MWRIRVALTDLELALIRHPLVRRLHFISHSGASSIASVQSYSRLEHALGSFVLVAHYCPDDHTLRAAALLHGIGHLPFSHTLEGLAEWNHHHLGSACLSQVHDLLRHHHLDPTAVSEALSGTTSNALIGKPGLMNLDHLDSFVRSGAHNGWLSFSPPALLAASRITDCAVDVADAELASQVVETVYREAVMHSSWVNIGPTWALRELVSLLLGSVAPDELARLTDAELWAKLAHYPHTRHLARRLRLAPHEITVHPVEADDPTRTVSLRKFYRSTPLVAGSQPNDPHLLAPLEHLDLLPRHFAVTWNE